MSKDLTALLGCMQSEVTQLDPSGRPQVYETCLTERVVLPTPRDGSHVVEVACKHCQQALRIRVQNHRSVRRSRLISRLGLTASVCLWAAGAALALVYFVVDYPAPPSWDDFPALILLLLGTFVWSLVDRRAAFAGDVVAACTIEPAPEEKVWAKQVSRAVMRELPRHVLFDPEQELVPAGWGAELAHILRAARGKPSVASTTTPSSAEGVTPSDSRRAA